MTMLMIRCSILMFLLALGLTSSAIPTHADVTEKTDDTEWKLYTNARFGFSIRYPDGWRFGNPMPDGVGVILYPPIEQSLVAVSGHMNVISGSSPEGRQTLDEFASAHHRIITDIYGKKQIMLRWQPDQERSLAGFPGKELVFTYTDDKDGEIIEHHIFSLGRNEGRGIRVKVPRSAEDRVMPTIRKMLETYQPGRDQNAVSPLVPK
ncbi:DcrB/PsbP domain-containing protein [Nitrospira sp. CMX1]